MIDCETRDVFLFPMSSRPVSPFGARETFSFGPGRTGELHSLPRLEKDGVGRVSRLPVSLRIVLESLLRNVDGRRVREKDVIELANWKPNAERTAEIPFVVASAPR